MHLHLFFMSTGNNCENTRWTKANTYAGFLFCGAQLELLEMFEKRVKNQETALKLPLLSFLNSFNLL